MFKFEEAALSKILPRDAVEIAAELRDVQVLVNGVWHRTTRKLYTLRPVNGGPVFDVRETPVRGEALRDGAGPVVWAGATEIVFVQTRSQAFSFLCCRVCEESRPAAEWTETVAESVPGGSDAKGACPSCRAPLIFCTEDDPRRLWEHDLERSNEAVREAMATSEDTHTGEDSIVVRFANGLYQVSLDSDCSRVRCERNNLACSAVFNTDLSFRVGGVTGWVKDGGPLPSLSDEEIELMKAAILLARSAKKIPQH